MTIKNGKGALRCRAFFQWRIVDEYDILEGNEWKVKVRYLLGVVYEVILWKLQIWLFKL